MSSQNTEQHFIKTFNSMARHQHRYQVFRDFVVLSAISLHNSVAKNDTLEAEYMEIIGKYSKEEAQKIYDRTGHKRNYINPDELIKISDVQFPATATKQHKEIVLAAKQPALRLKKESTNIIVNNSLEYILFII